MALKRFDISNGNKKEWIDILDPDASELDEVAGKYRINRHIVRDCLDPDHLPKHERLNECSFMITRLFNGNVKAHQDSFHEFTTKIAIFYNKEFLITIHRKEHPMLDSLREEARKNQNWTTSDLVTSILSLVLQTYERPAIMLGEQIDSYETTVLLKHTRPALLQGLYYIKRKASACRKLLLLTDDLIHYLQTANVEESSVQDVRDLYTKLLTLYDQVLEDVTNLMNTYLSLTAQKTNEVMKVLTVFSVFFMPLTFIAGIYGMNFRNMPELEVRYGYPAVLSVMVVLALAIFIWFRKKRWL